MDLLILNNLRTNVPLTPLPATFYGKFPRINILAGPTQIDPPQTIDSRELSRFDLHFFLLWIPRRTQERKAA
jgi:hypothetical protein